MKLGEVCLLTSDVRRLAAFYRQMLDISETCDDPVHQFITTEEPALTIFNDGKEHSAERSPITLAFTVDDIRAEHKKLLAMHAEILQPPLQQPWGAVNMILRDPDGNVIYLRQLKKGN